MTAGTIEARADELLRGRLRENRKGWAIRAIRAIRKHWRQKPAGDFRATRGDFWAIRPDMCRPSTRSMRLARCKA